MFGLKTLNHNVLRFSIQKLAYLSHPYLFPCFSDGIFFTRKPSASLQSLHSRLSLLDSALSGVISLFAPLAFSLLVDKIEEIRNMASEAFRHFMPLLMLVR